MLFRSNKSNQMLSELFHRASATWDLKQHQFSSNCQGPALFVLKFRVRNTNRNTGVGYQCPAGSTESPWQHRRRGSNAVKMPCDWLQWAALCLLVLYVYLPMGTDTCGARGVTSRRLKVHTLPHHTHSFLHLESPVSDITLVNITVPPRDIISPQADWCAAQLQSHYLCPLPLHLLVCAVHLLLLSDVSTSPCSKHSRRTEVMAALILQRIASYGWRLAGFWGKMSILYTLFAPFVLCGNVASWAWPFLCEPIFKVWTIFSLCESSLKCHLMSEKKFKANLTSTFRLSVVNSQTLPFQE